MFETRSGWLLGCLRPTNHTLPALDETVRAKILLERRSWKKYSSHGKNTPQEEVRAKLLSRGRQGKNKQNKQTTTTKTWEIRSGQKYCLREGQGKNTPWREGRHFVADSCKLCFAYWHRLQCTDVMLSWVLFLQLSTFAFLDFWFDFYFFKPFHCQQCMQSIRLETSSAETATQNHLCRSAALQISTFLL